MGTWTAGWLRATVWERHVALARFVEAMAAAVVLTVGLAAMRDPSVLSVLVLLASVTLIVTGHLLRRDEEQVTAGVLLHTAALFLSLSNSVAAFGAATETLALVTSWWAVPPLGMVLLTYPRNWFARRWHAWLIAAVTVQFVALWTVQVVEPLLDPAGAGLVVLDAVLYYGGLPLPVLACVALAQRWREAAPPERRAVRSVAVVGLALCSTFAVRLLAFALAESGPAMAAAHDIVRMVNLACLGVAPLGLLLETVRRRSAQRAMLEDLLHAGGDAGRVQASMARALSDPTLRLALRLDEATGPRLVDTKGVAVGAAAAGRVVRELHCSDGGLLGRVDADSSTMTDGAQLRVILAAAALALDNIRLHASLLNTLEEVRRSRARIVEAGFQTRRQLERDLHDGAQQQLLAVAAMLASVEHLSTDDARKQVVADARAVLAAALGELRRLARGIHPAVLSQGLPRALPTLADNAPVPIIVDIPQELGTTRLPTPVETTLWFVAAEAVTNAVRHSGSARIGLTLRIETSSIRMRVQDDGRGGAQLVPGGGLAGLADRVAALDGELSLHSPPTEGTHLEVILPCRL